MGLSPRASASAMPRACVGPRGGFVTTKRRSYTVWASRSSQSVNDVIRYESHAQLYQRHPARDQTRQQLCAESSGAITFHTTPLRPGVLQNSPPRSGETALRLRDDIHEGCCHRRRWVPDEAWHCNTIRKLRATGVVSAQTEGVRSHVGVKHRKRLRTERLCTHALRHWIGNGILRTPRTIMLIGLQRSGRMRR